MFVVCVYEGYWFLYVNLYPVFMFNSLAIWDSFIIDSPSILPYLETELVFLMWFFLFNCIGWYLQGNVIQYWRYSTHVHILCMYNVYIFFNHVKQVFIIFFFLHCFYPEWVLSCVKNFSASVIIIIWFFSLDWSVSCFILTDVLILSRLAPLECISLYQGVLFPESVPLILKL